MNKNTLARGEKELRVKKKPTKPFPRNPRKSTKVKGTFPNNNHPKTGPTVQAIIDALIKMHGMITKAARILHCDVKTITNRMREYPEIQEALEEAKARRLDEAETMLDRNIAKGDQRAIEFFLSKKGKSRGYGQELKGKDDEIDLGTVVAMFEAALEETKPPSFSQSFVMELGSKELTATSQIPAHE